MLRVVKLKYFSIVLPPQLWHQLMSCHVFNKHVFECISLLSIGTLIKSDPRECSIFSSKHQKMAKLNTGLLKVLHFNSKIYIIPNIANIINTKVVASITEFRTLSVVFLWHLRHQLISCHVFNKHVFECISLLTIGTLIRSDPCMKIHVTLKWTLPIERFLTNYAGECLLTWEQKTAIFFFMFIIKDTVKHTINAHGRL